MNRKSTETVETVEQFKEETGGVAGANDSFLIKGDADLLKAVKERIDRARIAATLAASREMMLMYYDVGKMVSMRLGQDVSERKVIEKLAANLRKEIPDIKGFSRMNIYTMRRFYDSCC